MEKRRNENNTFSSILGGIEKSFLICSEYPEVIFYLVIIRPKLPRPHQESNDPFYPCYTATTLAKFHRNRMMENMICGNHRGISVR